jgi:hypothetical protein
VSSSVDILFYNAFIFQLLRNLLDQQGFSKTRIVAADVKWNIAEDILRDPDLAASVDYIG